MELIHNVVDPTVKPVQQIRQPITFKSKVGRGQLEEQERRYSLRERRVKKKKKYLTPQKDAQLSPQQRRKIKVEARKRGPRGWQEEFLEMQEDFERQENLELDEFHEPKTKGSFMFCLLFGLLPFGLKLCTYLTDAGLNIDIFTSYC